MKICPVYPGQKWTTSLCREGGCIYYNFVNQGCGLEFRGPLLQTTFNSDNYKSVIVKVEKIGSK